MRSAAKRRFPVILIILFALVGIALSVAIGRVIAAGARETAASRIIEENRATTVPALAHDCAQGLDNVVDIGESFRGRR